MDFNGNPIFPVFVNLVEINQRKATNDLYPRPIL